MATQTLPLGKNPYALLFLLLLPLPAIFGQTPVLDTREYGGNIWASVLAEPGYEYQLYRSGTLKGNQWFPLTDTFYGLGAAIDVPVYETPVPPPPATGPMVDAIPAYFFNVQAFANRSALIGWTGHDGWRYGFVPVPPISAPSFYTTNAAGQPLSGFVSTTVYDESNPPVALYNVFTFVTVGEPSSNLSADYGSIPTEDQDSYLAIIDSAGAVSAALLNPPTPPAPSYDPARQFDDRGHPLEQYYRAQKLAPDSNFDGVKDWQEYASEIVLVPWSPANPDNDYTYDPAHLVPNAYFSDSTTRRFSNLIINEVWFDARTTPAVPPSQPAADWIELYNPTSAVITINNWKLEATKSGVTTTWTFPATPAISVPSGGFRVINASGLGTYPSASFSLEGSTLQSIQLKNASSVLVNQFVLASVPGAAAHSQPFDCARWLGNPAEWVVPLEKFGTHSQHNQVIAPSPCAEHARSCGCDSQRLLRQVHQPHHQRGSVRQYG